MTGEERNQSLPELFWELFQQEKDKLYDLIFAGKTYAAFQRVGELLCVKVHTPDKREGAVLPAKRASTASTIQASAFRFCRRQVSTTVSIRSTNRLPSGDCVPNDSFRQITA